MKLRLIEGDWSDSNYGGSNYSGYSYEDAIDEDAINPDFVLLHGRPGTIIVWLQDRDGNFIYKPGTKYHEQISNNYDSDDDHEQRSTLQGRSGIIDIDGEPTHVSAFWDSPQEIYDAHYKECLQELLNHNIATHNSLVFSPMHQGVPIADVLRQIEPVIADPEQQTRLQMAQRMHLARGQEKQNIMKQLGVGGGGSDAPAYRGSQYWNLRQTSESRTPP